MYLERSMDSMAVKASIDIDIALLDWIGKKLNVPLYRFRTGSSSSPR
jgi:L-alanine-DL-glutamate epimerase-like enolase superfamily enzyme